MVSRNKSPYGRETHLPPHWSTHELPNKVHEPPARVQVCGRPHHRQISRSYRATSKPRWFAPAAPVRVAACVPTQDPQLALAEIERAARNLDRPWSPRCMRGSSWRSGRPGVENIH